jgi:dethiobiotin synthetase
MTRKPVPGLFITGADTDVGKTYIAALIARALVAAGHRVGVYKPAASGCQADGDELVSDDALALWQAAGSQGELMRVCPQRFKSPVAPNLAARAEGRKIDTDLLRSGLDYWRECSDVVLVEGAGGLMSPITDDEYIADLAYDFGYPLVVVARNQIGVINQVLQTLIVANTFRRGLGVAGVVLNHPQQRNDDPSVETNRRELAQRAVPPILAEVHHGDQKLPEVDWFRLAEGRGS